MSDCRPANRVVIGLVNFNAVVPVGGGHRSGDVGADTVSGDYIVGGVRAAGLAVA